MISSPNPVTGIEETVYRRIFDENWYFQVCENSYKQEVHQYFNQGPSIEELGNKKSHEQYCLPIDFPTAFFGRFLKIQIDLLDSYKSVHKMQPMTSIFIRPEFFGYKSSQEVHYKESEIKKHYIYAPQATSLLMKIAYPDGASYNFYNIPGDNLSQINKAVAVTCNEEDIDLIANTQTASSNAAIVEESKNEDKKEEGQAESEVQKLKEERETLKQIVKKGSTSKA